MFSSRRDYQGTTPLWIKEHLSCLFVPVTVLSSLYVSTDFHPERYPNMHTYASHKQRPPGLPSAEKDWFWKRKGSQSTGAAMAGHGQGEERDDELEWALLQRRERSRGAAATTGFFLSALWLTQGVRVSPTVPPNSCLGISFCHKFWHIHPCRRGL